MQKLFSIIIPSYNNYEGLKSTLESIFVQKNELFECIVMDACSNDRTPELIEKYQGSVRFYVEKDEGIYDAMNKGVAKSTGRYLYFMGGGDILYPGVLEQVADIIEHKNYGFIYGDIFKGYQNKVAYSNINKYTIGFFNIFHQCIFYRKDTHAKLGDYNTNYIVSADHAMNIKCYGDKSISKKHIPIVIANYIGQGHSTMHIDQQFLSDQLGMIFKHLGLLASCHFIFMKKVQKVFEKTPQSINNVLKKFYGIFNKNIK